MGEVVQLDRPGIARDMTPSAQSETLASSTPESLSARLQADLDASAEPAFRPLDGYVEMRTSRGVNLLERNAANYHWRRYREVIDQLLRSKDPEDHVRAWRVEDLALDLDHAMRVAWPDGIERLHPIGLAACPELNGERS